MQFYQLVCLFAQIEIPFGPKFMKLAIDKIIESGVVSWLEVTSFMFPSRVSFVSPKRVRPTNDSSCVVLRFNYSNAGGASLHLISLGRGKGYLCTAMHMLA